MIPSRSMPSCITNSTTDLVKCRDDFHLWSQTYDRQLDDVFAIQDEVVAAVWATFFSIGARHVASRQMIPTARKASA